MLKGRIHCGSKSWGRDVRDGLDTAPTEAWEIACEQSVRGRKVTADAPSSRSRAADSAADGKAGN